jgi:hypothetical protein
MQRTTIAVPPTTRDRLQAFGRKGMSYAQILERLMDSVDRTRYLADLEDGIEHPVPPRDATSALAVTAEHWRRHSAEDKLLLGETLRRQGVLAGGRTVRRRRPSRGNTTSSR